MNQGTGSGHFVNERQRLTEDRELLRRVVRRSKIVSHWSVYEQASRRFDLRCQVKPGRDTHSGDVRLFRDATNQTHGLVVEGSGGNREQNVDAVLTELLDERRRGFLNELGTIVDTAHETAPMPVCNATYLCGALQLTKPGDWEDAVCRYLRTRFPAPFLEQR